MVEKSMDDLLVATEMEENVLGLEDDHEDPTKEEVLLELTTLTLSLQASFEDAEREECEKLGSKIEEAIRIHGMKVADMDRFLPMYLKLKGKFDEQGLGETKNDEDDGAGDDGGDETSAKDFEEKSNRKLEGLEPTAAQKRAEKVGKGNGQKSRGCGRCIC